MSKLKFGSDAQADKFEKNIRKLQSYVKKHPDHTLLETLNQILKDNFEMFNHITQHTVTKEKKDGESSSSIESEQGSSQP